MATSFNLNQQAALVTGASQGIGAAIARGLVHAGAHVVISARNESALNTLKNQLLAKYPDASIHVVTADLTQLEACATLVQQAEQQLGSALDILINNAGVAGKISLLTEITDADIVKTIQTNLIAPALLTKHVLPGMVSKGRGHIVNINSIAGKTAYPYWSVYCASKFGLAALSESVGEEQRSNGIKITGIYPGAVDTPIWEGIDANPHRAAMLSDQTIAEAVLMALTQPEATWISDVTIKPLHSVL